MTDYQALFNAMALKAKTEGLADSGMIGLGHLYDLLNAQDKEAVVLIEHNGGLRPPGALESYRGYYEDLSFDLDGTTTYVFEILAEIDRYLNKGRVYTGYKGGDFYANPRTLVWASSYGNYDGIGVTGVTAVDGTVIITTVDTEAGK